MTYDPIPRARALRQSAPLTERSVWELLRNRRMFGFKFRRQHPIGRYFADFACLEARLVIELDGPSHDGREDYDARRTAELEGMGWRVMRFTSEAAYLNTDGVSAAIERELKLVIR